MDSLETKAMIDALAAFDLKEMEFSRNGWALRLALGPEGDQPTQGADQPPLRLN
jgi:hypothetical protein